VRKKKRRKKQHQQNKGQSQPNLEVLITQPGAREQPDGAEDAQISKNNTDPANNTGANSSTSQWVIAALTAIIAVVSYYQWRTAQESINLTREAFERGSRAYIGRKDAGLYRTKKRNLEVPNLPYVVEGAREILYERSARIDLSATPYVLVEFKNFGQTPANNTSADMWMTITNALTQESILASPRRTPPHDPHSSANVSKDELFNLSMATELSSDDLENIIRGKRYLVSYAEVSYVDIFNKPHNTKVCVFYSARDNEMAICPVLNSMD